HHSPEQKERAVVHPTQEKPFFVATGILNTDRNHLVPKSFWGENLQMNGLWNKLQQCADNHFNGILYPKKAKDVSKREIFDDNLLEQTFTHIISREKRNNSEKLPDEMQDFINNMLKRDYPILIQPNGMCGAQAKREIAPPLILLAIKTTELNFKNRQAIRRTWGRAGWPAGGYVRRVFLLGRESSAEMGIDLSEVLRRENKLYGDILQWDFSDTFFNLTLKDVLFWSWFSQHCGQAVFVLKGDDDVLVNTPKLITYLHQQLNKSQNNNLEEFMVGDVIEAGHPNRELTSKYFIPESFYKGLYPTYAGGGGVVYSGLLARRLHNVSKAVHLFPIDDVYVGMCMRRLNIHPLHHSAFLTLSFLEEEEQCAYHSILLVHKRSPKQLVKLWADMKKTQKQCEDVPLRAAEKEEE
uniref:Hexosyltransferase n=1 Tax=Nothobranchius furzeri TaxID=105023 RepID=A0A8C6NH85_NOTFU